jgi:hypothetical protein
MYVLRVVEATDGRTGVVSNVSDKGERTLRGGAIEGVVVPCELSSVRGERRGVNMSGATLIACLKSARYINDSQTVMKCEKR